MPPVFANHGCSGGCHEPRSRCGPAEKAGRENPRLGPMSVAPLIVDDIQAGTFKTPRQPLENHAIGTRRSWTTALRSVGVAGRQVPFLETGTSSIAANSRHHRSSCMGGHFIDPNEQNTQQSPGLGLSRAPQ